jgi:hypothetical protein
MATIPVNVTIPDAEVPTLLAALQAVIPLIGGETSTQYVKRVVGIILKAKIKQILAQQASQAAAQAAAAAQGDPPVTTS